jgi:hypothetical protein
VQKINKQTITGKYEETNNAQSLSEAMQEKSTKRVRPDLL